MTLTYWLTDRQSQFDFDSDFDFGGSWVSKESLGTAAAEDSRDPTTAKDSWNAALK
jgi:hypothetical protein